MTMPLTFADAETCLQLTLRALNLKAEDAEFLEKAMRAYGNLCQQEIAADLLADHQRHYNQP